MEKITRWVICILCAIGLGWILGDLTVQAVEQLTKVILH